MIYKQESIAVSRAPCRSGWGRGLGTSRHDFGKAAPRWWLTRSQYMPSQHNQEIVRKSPDPLSRVREGLGPRLQTAGGSTRSKGQLIIITCAI